MTHEFSDAERLALTMTALAIERGVPEGSPEHVRLLVRPDQARAMARAIRAGMELTAPALCAYPHCDRPRSQHNYVADTLEGIGGGIDDHGFTERQGTASPAATEQPGYGHFGPDHPVYAAARATIDAALLYARAIPRVLEDALARLELELDEAVPEVPAAADEWPFAQPSWDDHFAGGTGVQCPSRMLGVGKRCELSEGHGGLHRAVGAGASWGVDRT